jgi:hypothetical protein
MVSSNSVKWVKKQSYFCKMAKKFISEQYNNLEVVDITAQGKGVVKSEDGKVTIYRLLPNPTSTEIKWNTPFPISAGLQPMKSQTNR